MLLIRMPRPAWSATSVRVPLASVPMRLPSTMFLMVPGPVIVDADAGVGAVGRDVTRDDVARPRSGPGRQAADGVVRGTDDEDPRVVPQRTGAGDVEADEVTLDKVPRRPGAEDLDADPTAIGLAVARDDVAGRGRRPTDRVVGRGDGGRGDGHTSQGVGQSDGASDIGADIIALDHVVGRHALARVDENAIKPIARDEITVRVDRPPNRIVRNINDGYAEAVGEGHGAGDVGAEVVARDHIITFGNERDSRPSERVDHQPLHRTVSGGDRQAIDDVGGSNEVSGKRDHRSGMVGIVAGLGRAVDFHRDRNRRKWRGGRDGERALSRDLEIDLPVPLNGAGVGDGVENRGAERTWGGG